MSRALLCECGSCHRCKARERMRVLRAADPENAKTQYRTWHYSKGPEYHRDRHRKWIEANREQARESARNKQHSQTPRDPARRRATDLVTRALRSGRLVRQPCEVCGQSPIGHDGRSLVHAHHDDYDAPLEVRWLCSIHHGEEHRAVAA